MQQYPFFGSDLPLGPYNNPYCNQIFDSSEFLRSNNLTTEPMNAVFPCPENVPQPNSTYHYIYPYQQPFTPIDNLMAPSHEFQYVFNYDMNEDENEYMEYQTPINFVYTNTPSLHNTPNEVVRSQTRTFINSGIINNYNFVFSSRPDVALPLMSCRWIDVLTNEMCSQQFHNVKILGIHITVDHIRKSKRNKHICYWADCERKLEPFPARYKLVHHVRVHTGEKPFVCTFYGCQRTFARTENLVIHTRIHTGEKPFTCAICKKKFSNSSDRKKHLNVHNNEKKFKCPYEGCSNKYTHPSSLRKHVKKHTANSSF